MSKTKKMNLFYTMKITTSEIVQNNFYIKSSFDLLSKNRNIVSLGDSQLLKFIRRLKGIEFNPEEIDELVRQRKELQKLPKNKRTSRKIADIQSQVNEKLFIPDLVSVKCDTTKKDYKEICKRNFIVDVTINEKNYIIKYKRLCAGAGQLRRNTALFVNEELYDMLENIMMCGLTKEKIGKINLAKFSAYYALYTSAASKVRTPRICVVDDFEYVLPNQEVVWIEENDQGVLDTSNKKIDMPINAFDGAGMVSPEMARLWQEDLGLDYLPASFIVRAPFIKGLVSVFDFHRFANEVAHKEYITDHWGQQYKADEIDVILSISQFKMYKRYNSFTEYMYYYKKFGHIFNVARVSKKKNNEMTTLNYQYIQTNKFTEETIKGLASYTTDWLQKVMSGDRLFTMLLVMGAQNSGATEQEILNNLDSDVARAFMYSEDIIKDTYVRKQVSKLIEKKIKQAKIGKLYVEGSYDFTIPDLYAFAEHAFGMEPVGLLKAEECWNKRWVDKGSPVVTLMRSPLVAPGENRKLRISFDERCRDWFQYIYSGNIYNIWDTTIIAQSDADKSVVRDYGNIVVECGEPINVGCAV